MNPSTLTVLYLSLADGTERPYLIEDPAPEALAAGAVYDPWVHLTHVLAQQGRDPDWLARFTGLPPAAVHRITEAARQSQPALSHQPC
ncbi:hypothetical protein A6P39_011930 [Streptomyces sp. FXJ1.172]|uniref:hypothetical protein n=1 Tax=Streptomyces sp. FXJ1.172 TaxID=710705 RepID=UPI0007CF69B2|nr:hypothetical protein [Streptomyces sp. FXJ1.172]WEO94656.1 hypothetical protein A6P39_011930 [Streptomyces sp. FXJ1.172]